jgi:hypothetical protein
MTVTLFSKGFLMILLFPFPVVEELDEFEITADR